MLTDFNFRVQEFFTFYLPKDLECSAKTIESYADTFRLFLNYIKDYEGILVEDMTLALLTRDLVQKFLRYLTDERKNCVITKKARKAAIDSFIEYVKYKVPMYLKNYYEILDIKIIVKEGLRHAPVYLTQEGLKAFIETVLEDHSLLRQRNIVLMSIMIGTGVRESEVLNIRPKDIQLGTPATIVIYGKGGISRQVPLQKSLRKTLENYLKDTGLDHPERREEYIFKNQYGDHLSRHGLYNIVKKYADITRKKNPGIIPDNVYPHVLRHTFATLNVAIGVDLIYVRDLLGHSSVTTTENYYVGLYKKTKEANAVAESLSEILESENITDGGSENQISENTLNFLNNLTRRRAN